MNDVLRIENLNKSFFQAGLQIDVLKSVNLSVKKGEIISVLGSSGSGKSTLLQIAGLLDSKYEGKVIYDGKETRKLDQNQKAHLRLKKIGFVYQYHHLLKDFTTTENIALPGIISGESMTSAKKKAENLLEILGMQNRANFYPGQLSGGQQQRVAIARAMFNDPDIIFADEPTGNLDYESANIVFDLFLNLAKKHKLAIVMVTHNQTLGAKCDKCFQLQNGKLISE
ncbi:MAG: ABC transporter ATP-binding protein [Rickettsiaceae bacterium]|nr:ABC transporter ATP-binding protein [Rickettsiaceae bacterium]